MDTNLDKIERFEFVLEDNTKSSLEFKGKLEGHIAHTLLRVNSLETLNLQNYELVEKLGNKILTELNVNQESNKTCIDLVQSRLEQINILKSTGKELKKERIVSSILEAVNDRELENVINEFLFYGGSIWDIPKYLLENKEAQNNTTKFITLFEKACQVISIGRKIIQESEVNSLHQVDQIFQQKFNNDDATLAFQYLQQKLIDHTRTNRLHNPLPIDEPSLFGIACDLQLPSFARLLHEINHSPPIHPSTLLQFFNNNAKGTESNGNEVLNFLIKKIDLSLGSMSEKRTLLNKILSPSFKTELLTQNFIEKLLIELLKYFPTLEQSVQAKLIQIAITSDNPKLFDYLLAERKDSLIKKSDSVKIFQVACLNNQDQSKIFHYLTHECKFLELNQSDINNLLKMACRNDLPKLLEYLVFKQNDISLLLEERDNFFPNTSKPTSVLSFLFENVRMKSIQMICETHSQNIKIKNELLFHTLKFVKRNTHNKNEMVRNIDNLQPYESKEEWIKQFGDRAEILWPIIEKIKGIGDSEIRVQKLTWVFSILLESSIPANELKSNFFLLESLFDYRNPKEREQITECLFTLYKPDQKIELEKWQAVRSALSTNLTKKKQVWFISCLLLVPYFTTNDPTKEPLYQKFTSRRSDMFDGKRAQAFSQLLLILKNKIDIKKAGDWLMLSFDSENKNKRLSNWNLLKNLSIIGFKKQLIQFTTLDECRNHLQKKFCSTFGLENIENFSEKYENTIGTFRDPSAFFSYQGTLSKDHPGQDPSGPFKQLFNEFVRAVLEGTFPHIRYRENTHSKTVFKDRPELALMWQNGDKKKAKDLFAATGVDISQKDRSIPLDPEWDVVDTDQANDLLMMGEEVQGSCQSLSSPESIYLTGFIMDGKSRLIAVKDREGKIIGRCILRILWDSQSKRPILFQERFYVNNENKHVTALIKAECLERAKTMGLALLVLDNDPNAEEHNEFYPSAVESLGGSIEELSIKEYVDALGKNAITPPIYKIPRAKILYKP